MKTIKQSADKGISRFELVDILKRRNVETIYYFHTDHYEPWSSGLNERTALGVERFAEMSLASPFAHRMSLFYSPFIPSSLDHSEKQRAGGRGIAGDRVVFNPRTEQKEKLARKVISPLFGPNAHEFHLHVHHEFWTRNESHFDSEVSKWVNANSTAELDRDRLDLFFSLCRETIGREVGRRFDRWAFIHGNWALAASDPLICTIENELGMIMRHGGFGDFTFPAGRAYCDPRLQWPFTCRPIEGKRPYDDPVSDPKPLTEGGGVLEEDRFFIWNSPIKAQFSSLDYYHEPNRALFRESARILFEWLTNSVVLGSDLYLKTHAHSMKWEYEIFKPDSRIPHLYPDVVRLFEELLRVCDDAEVEFRLATVNEIMVNLEAFDARQPPDSESNVADFGPSMTKAPAPKDAVDAPALPEALRETAGLLPVEFEGFSAEVLELQCQWIAGNGTAFPADELYVFKTRRGAALETYEAALASVLARTFDPKTTAIIEVGSGYGALALLLARCGFDVESYDGNPSRAAAAAWHAKQYVVRYPALGDRLHFVSGFFPDAWPSDRHASRTTHVGIATNITCTYTATNKEWILDELSQLDELIVDLGRFGVALDEQAERDVLRAEIARHGFYAVERLYFSAPCEYWRFRKRAASMGDPAVAANVDVFHEGVQAVAPEPVPAAVMSGSHDAALIEFDRVDAVAVALLRQWLEADPAHVRAAGDYYTDRLARGRLFLDNERALASYCQRSFEASRSRFIEMGSGFGELSLMLALQGFQATGFESHAGRHAGACALLQGLASQDIAPSGLTVVFGAVPSALTLDRIAGPDEVIFVSTNVTSSHVMQNIETVLRALRLFDHLLIDVARFGIAREQEARQALIEELNYCGFAEIASIYRDSNSDIRHFRRNVAVSVKALAITEPDSSRPLRSIEGPPLDDELCWMAELGELLLPTLRHQLERFGDRQTGMYDFYRRRLAEGVLLEDYEVAVAKELVRRRESVDCIDEIGSGLGQLVFLLGWNGFHARGFEADAARASMARRLRRVLDMTDPELTARVGLLEENFPSATTAPPTGNSLVLTTNLVASRTPEQQAEIVRALRRYTYAVVDIQRLFVHRQDERSQADALALFADAGFEPPQPFLDLGLSGRYVLFSNSPQRGVPRPAVRLDKRAGQP